MFKIKNNTNKPIGIGILNLMPGATDTLPQAYEKHPVVQMLATKKYDDEHTFITLTEEKEVKEPVKATEKTTAKAGKSKGAETGSEE